MKAPYINRVPFIKGGGGAHKGSETINGEKTNKTRLISAQIAYTELVYNWLYVALFELKSLQGN
jgi:hypothetical protein